MNPEKRLNELRAELAKLKAELAKLKAALKAALEAEADRKRFTDEMRTK